MSCSELITLPFTAGNLYTSSNGRTHHDGSISKTVVVTSVLAFVAVLISLQANSSSCHVILDPMVMKLSLTVIVAAGICSTIYLAKLANRQSPTFVCQKSSACFHRLQIGFLWLFGIGVMLICILNIARLASCDSEITQVVPSREFGVNIGYHASRIVLVVTEVFFISFFSHVKFNHCLSTYYALLFIILANTSVWIYYYLALDEESLFWIFNVSNATFPQINSAKACFQNSTIGVLSLHVDRILFPVNTEFSLLVLKVVLEMWSLELPETPGAIHVNSVMGITETTADRPTPDVDRVRPSHQPVDERSSLLDTDWEYRLHNSDGSTSRDNTCPVSFYLAMVVSFSMFLPLAVMYLVLEYRFPDSDTFYRITEAYELAYKVAMLVAVACTWVYLQKDGKPITEHSSLKSMDYTLLLGTFGVAVYSIHVLIAGSLTKSHTGTEDIILTIISMVFLYLQTTLLLQTRRYTPKRRVVRNFPSFRSLCTVLSILNFGFWITDSFVGMRFQQSASTPKGEVFGSEYWAFVMHYVFPLVIFYRLESGFAFLRLYGDFSGEDIVQ